MLILHKRAGRANRPRQLQKKALSPLQPAQGDLICFCSCLDTDVFFSCGDSNCVFGNILSTRKLSRLAKKPEHLVNDL